MRGGRRTLIEINAPWQALREKCPSAASVDDFADSIDEEGSFAQMNATG